MPIMVDCDSLAVMIKFYILNRVLFSLTQLLSLIINAIIIMHNFPFLSMMLSGDGLDCPLAAAYDPSYPLLAFQEPIPKEEVAKVEEPTSPAYNHVDAADEPEETKKGRRKIGPKQQKSRRISKTSPDDDYKPYKRPHKGRGPVKQKQDRNLIPNTVHHLLAFVQKQFKSSYLVQKIFPVMSPNPNFSIARFYNFHRMLRAQINNYVNEEAMRTIIEPGVLQNDQFGTEEQEFYCKVSRVLVRKFLKVEAVLMILRSKKVRRENILEHLSVQRFLYENMTALARL